MANAECECQSGWCEWATLKKQERPFHDIVSMQESADCGQNGLAHQGRSSNRLLLKPEPNHKLFSMLPGFLADVLWRYIEVATVLSIGCQRGCKVATRRSTGCYNGLFGGVLKDVTGKSSILQPCTT
jgi:hypothetical protein